MHGDFLNFNLNTIYNITMYVNSLKYVMPVFIVSGFFSSFINVETNDTPITQLIRTLKYTSLATGLGLVYPVTISVVIFKNA